MLLCVGVVIGWLHLEDRASRQRSAALLSAAAEGGGLAPAQLQELRALVQQQEREFVWDSVLTGALALGGGLGIALVWRSRGRARDDLVDSEERFRSLVEQSGDGVVTVQDGIVTYVNRRAAEIAGRAEAEIIGQPATDFVVPEHRERLAAAFRELAQSGQPRAGEPYEVLRPDGSRRRIEVRSSRMQARGHMTLVGVFHDDTARWQAERAQKESNELVRAIEDSLPNAVVVLDAAGRVLAVNAAWQSFVARRPDDTRFAAVRVDADFLPVAERVFAEAPPLQREFCDGVRAVLAGRQDVYRRDVDLRIGERRRWFTFTAVPLRTERGGAVLTWTEITARLRAEEAAVASALQYRTMVTALSEGVIIVDGRGRALACNPAAEQILGLTQQQIVDSPETMSAWPVQRPDGSEMPVDEMPVASLLASGQPQRNRLVGYRRRQGDIIWLLVNAEPLRDGPGASLSGAVVSFADITERKRVEDELEHARQTLETRVQERTAELQRAIAALGESDAFMRTVADHQPSLVAYWTRDGRLRYANRAYLEWFGLREDEVIGQPFEAVLPPAALASVRAAADRVLAGETTSGPKEMRSAGGRSGDFWIHRTPDTGSDGTVRGWFFFAHDMSQVMQTERRLAAMNEALTESVKFSRLIADSLPGRVTYWSAAGVCRFVNRAWCDWYGQRAEEVVGHPIGSVLNAESLSACEPHLPAVLAGEPREFSRRETRLDGSAAETWSQMLPDRREGRVQGFFVLCTDVTEMRASEQRLRELNDALTASRDRAEAANLAKSAFLANMSHEIRTPMNAIVGLTHLLSREIHDAAQRRRLDKIADAADHLLELVNDVLDLSKIEAGKLTLDLREFAPGEMVSRTVALVADRAREKGLELVVRTDGLPAHARGDEMRLSQALLNLLSNAVKFTERGSVRLEARIESTTDAGDRVRFDVIDTGVGVAPEKLPQLFNAFEQVDNSLTRRHGGTGLGLAITRRLAELMGGTVGADSHPGRGSRFWFSAELGRAQHVAPRSPRGPMTGLRALLVDDAPETRLAIGTLMHDFGLRTETAAAPTPAIARVDEARRQGQPFDVVVIDWQMPEMDGLELARRLRADGHAGALVLASASQAPSLEGLALAAGFDRTLTKPVTEAALHECLVELLVDRLPATGPRAARTAPSDGSDAELARRARGQRVLVVEDNEINQEVAVELLSAAGVQVDVAGDGAQAVRMAAEHDYALVLMDVQMPVMDGLAATRAIRALPGRQAWPIVAMTANAFARDREACLAAGMNDHIAKPVDPKKLHAALLRWLPAGSVAAGAVVDTALPPAMARLGGMPGFDAAEGVRLSGLRPELFLAVLRRFVDVYAAGVPALRELAQSGQAQEVARLSHSLRGACATIGATALQSRAEALEALSHAAPAPATLAERAHELESELKTLIAGLRERLA